MIRVIIELVPYGQEDWTKTLHTMFICNNGTSRDIRIGNYDYTILKPTIYKNHPDECEKSDILITGTLDNYDRLNYNTWNLVKAVLDKENINIES